MKSFTPAFAPRRVITDGAEEMTMMTDRAGPADPNYDRDVGADAGKGFTTAEAVREEDKTPLPRGEGADAPQKEIPEGHMALLYTEQEFNALVAANTAMTTEISSLNDKVAMLQAVIDERNSTIADLRAERTRAHATAGEWHKQLEKIEGELRETRINEQYHADHAAELQRKLDRALGYTDRFLDEDERHRQPRMRPAPPQPVGPDMSSIPSARRNDGRFDTMLGESFRSVDERMRRY